ncbi:MAG: DUF2304 domain-containing protein [Thermodesulfobacteriota bacterium]
MYLYQILAIVGALLLFAFVVDFVRRGLLKEKYSVLWLASALAILVLALRKTLLDTIAGYLGVAYAPSLLFLVAFLFVMLIILHFSVVISIFHDKNKVLAQEIAILKNALKEAGLLPDETKNNEGEKKP